MDLRLVANRFPKKLARSLTFEKKDDRIIIKAKHQLLLQPKDLNQLSRLGGRLILAGKDSHFEIIASQLKKIC